MKIHPFVDAVASLQFEDCFNPYSDRCEVHDRRDAPRRRAAALSAMLRRATEEPVDAIWIGRDLEIPRRAPHWVSPDRRHSHKPARKALESRSDRRAADDRQCCG